MTASSIFTFCLLPFALALASCALWQPSVPEVPVTDGTAAKLTELLREREQSLQTVKGLFTAQVKGPGVPIAQTVYGKLFYRRPDALRLQGFNRLGGGVLFDFFLDEGQYTLYLPTEARVLTGSQTELETQEGISQPIKLSVFAMTGLIGVQSVSPHDRVLVFEDEDLYRLEVHSRDGDIGGRPATPLRRIWFERRSFHVVREDRLTVNGEVEGTLELEDYREVGTSPDVASRPPEGEAMALPFKINAESGQGDGSIRVTFLELVPNVPLGEKELQAAWFQNGDRSSDG